MQLIAKIGQEAQEEALKLVRLNDLTYTFEFFAPVGKTLVIEPRITEEDANLLF